MEVPKEILDKWMVLRSPEDGSEILKTMPQDNLVSIETIRRAIKDGKCNDTVFKAIADFYEKKADMIKQYL